MSKGKQSSKVFLYLVSMDLNICSSASYSMHDLIDAMGVWFKIKLLWVFLEQFSQFSVHSNTCLPYLEVCSFDSHSFHLMTVQGCQLWSKWSSHWGIQQAIVLILCDSSLQLCINHNFVLDQEIQSQNPICVEIWASDSIDNMGFSYRIRGLEM